MTGRLSGVLAQACHVLRKDVAAEAPLLGGVAILLALQLGGVLPGSEGLGERFRLPPRLALFPLLLSLLAVRVVQREHPTDPWKLWSTRPFHPTAVALAKSIYVGLFLCATPVLIQSAWFEYLEPAIPTMLMTRDALLHVGGLVFLAAGAGVMTYSFRSFLALALGLYVLAVLLPLLPLWPEARWNDRGVMATRTALTHLGWIAIGLGLVAHQYCTRRRLQGAVLGALAFVAVPAMAGVASLDWSTALPHAHRPPPTDSLQQERVGDIEVELRELQAEPLGRFLGTRSDGISGRFTGEGATGFSYRIVGVRARLHAGAHETSQDFDLTRNVGIEPPVLPTIAGLTPAADRFRERAGTPILFFAPLVEGSPSELEEVADVDRLEVQFTWEVSDWEEVRRTAPRPNTRIDVGPGEHLLIKSVSRGPRAVMLAIVHRWTPTSTLLLPPDREDVEDRYTFVLHSRSHGEYMTAYPGGSWPFDEETLVGGAWLRQVPIRVEFQARTVEGVRRANALPADWFDDIELIVLKRRPLGTLSRSFAWNISDWPEGPGRTVPVDEEGDPIEP